MPKYEFISKYSTVPEAIRNTRNKKEIQNYLQKVALEEKSGHFRKPTAEDRNNLEKRMDEICMQIQDDYVNYRNPMLDSKTPDQQLQLLMDDMMEGVEAAIEGYPGPLDQNMYDRIHGKFNDLIGFLSNEYYSLIPEEEKPMLEARFESLAGEYKGCLISKKDRDHLEQRIKNNESLERMIREKRRVPKPKPPVVDGNKILLDEIHQDMCQTTRNGCWSVSFQLLLQSRGIYLTQEEIRAYREDLTKEEYDNMKDSSQVGDADYQFNNDVTSNLSERAGLLMELCPNTMMKSVALSSFSINPEGATYVNSPARKETIRNIITEALTRDHSPVSVTDGSHFTTIVGISGDKVFYKDSRMSGEAPDKTYEKTLDDFAKTGNLQFYWLHEATINKEGKCQELEEVQDLFVKPDGTVCFDPKNPKDSNVGQGNYGQKSFGFAKSINQDNGLEPCQVFTHCSKKIEPPQRTLFRNIGKELSKLSEEFQETRRLDEKHNDSDKYRHMIRDLKKMSDYVKSLEQKEGTVSDHEWNLLKEWRKQAVEKVDQYIGNRRFGPFSDIGKARKELAGRMKQALDFDVNAIRNSLDDRFLREQTVEERQIYLNQIKPQADNLKQRCEVYPNGTAMKQLGTDAQNAMANLATAALYKKFDKEECRMNLAKVLCFIKLDSMKTAGMVKAEEIANTMKGILAEQLAENLLFKAQTTSMDENKLLKLLTTKDGMDQLSRNCEQKGIWDMIIPPMEREAAGLQSKAPSQDELNTMIP